MPEQEKGGKDGQDLSKLEQVSPKHESGEERPAQGVEGAGGAGLVQPPVPKSVDAKTSADPAGKTDTNAGDVPNPSGGETRVVVKGLDLSAEQQREQSPKLKELDLTGEPRLAQPAGLQAKSYDPAPHRELMRGSLAIGLLVLLACIVLGGLAAALIPLRWGRLADKDIITTLLASVTGLAGSALGFYFGSGSNLPK